MAPNLEERKVQHPTSNIQRQDGNDLLQEAPRGESVGDRGRVQAAEEVSGDRTVALDQSSSKPGRAVAFLELVEAEAEKEAERVGWFVAADIARAVGTHKKRVHRIAARDGWPRRVFENRVEYQPPRRIAEAIVESPVRERQREEAEGLTVRFADLAHSDEQRENVLLREAAVKLLLNNLHLGKEMALKLVVRHFRVKHPIFAVSVSALRRWELAYRAHGLDGLVEQKRGRSGRKGFALDLEADELLRTAAGAIEYGIKGRLNMARAYRELVGNPTVGSERGRPTWLHGEHASKSYVPPSVRAAVRELAPVSTVKLIQVGPKAMKLDGPYTESSYAGLRCGQAFTADDMTCNVYVWVEWPNEDGFLLLRPQLLVTMDVASMAFLNYRLVIRPKGQYNRDDVWGLIGDLFDSFGLFETAILEGGTWQSDLVRGQRTGIEDGTRLGGLKSLGVKVIHTRSPRGKIIEGAFNPLQHAADNCRGFCGRMEMKDCPELVKRHLADVRSGKAHPREHFLHLHEYDKHVAGAMQGLLNERNDGKILRGQSPWSKWASEKPALAQMPDAYKWMYRSAFAVCQVTRNGVRVTQGTGKFQQAYSYDCPTVLETWRGRRVVAYWNDSNPDTDAVIYTVRAGRPDKFLCVAERVREIPRLGASEEELGREAARKKLHAQLAVSKSQSLAQFLQRGSQTSQTGRTSRTEEVRGERDEGRGEIGERIEAARVKADEREAGRITVERTERRILAEAGDLSELGGGRGERESVGESERERLQELEELTLEELHEL